MKFFVDTAKLDEIKKAQEFGVLDGVTTNPSLMAKVGVKGQKNIHAHYKAICDIVDDNVSAEVIAVDFDGIMEEAHELAKIDKKIVVKVPMIPDGIRAIKVLSAENIRTNCTLVFSPAQALLAAKAGASYVSPFIGRLDDVSIDGLQLIADMVTIFSRYEFKTEVLVASVRHPIHVIESAKMGAGAATVPFSVLEQFFKHPLTDAGLDKFLKDYKESQK
ncbi:MAG TPA: fructose-6-phosphate aldolase [Candidatus Saccharimonadales bacterium]|nr:fructose-6-phosphate aldolase [Candidatus Saccharimonadales bacterium]